MTAPKLDSGTALLIEDLQQKPQSFARDELIARVRRLHYHDFKGRYDAPEFVLIRHLTLAGYPDLAERVLADRYTQPPSESQAWSEETPEGKALTEASKDPVVQAELNGILKRAGDPKFAASSLAWARSCIRLRDFSHRLFRDRASDKQAS